MWYSRLKKFFISSVGVVSLRINSKVFAGPRVRTQVLTLPSEHFLDRESLILIGFSSQCLLRYFVQNQSTSTGRTGIFPSLVAWTFP